MNEIGLRVFELATELELKCTCRACPELHEVYYNGKEVGYIRLRHGCLRAEFYTDEESVTVYAYGFDGDKGCLDADESDYYLKKCKRAIAKEIIKRGNMEVIK